MVFTQVRAKHSVIVVHYADVLVLVISLADRYPNEDSLAINRRDTLRRETLNAEELVPLGGTTRLFMRDLLKPTYFFQTQMTFAILGAWRTSSDSPEHRVPGLDRGFSRRSHVLHVSGFCELALTASLCLLTVNDVSVTRWRRINYVMGTQPVRRAINLGKAEMAGGAGLLSVTLGFRGCRTVSKPARCSGFLSAALPDFPAGSEP